MLKYYPRDNLMELMSHISIASAEQLAYFFRDVLGESASVMIENEVRHYTLITPTHNGLDDTSLSHYLQKQFAVPVPKDVAYKYVKAFWVIADFGSTNIKYVSNGQYPVQYIFTSVDDNNYDITVVDNIRVGELATMTRLSSLVKDYVDSTYHIAVISDRELIPPLKKLGFDFFYSVDIRNQIITRLE